MQHQPRPTRISRGVCASAGRHNPLPARFGQILHTSTVACAYWQTTSSHGMQYQPRPTRISRDMCASARRHHLWRTCIGQRHATSAKACTHQLWRVRIVWVTSIGACAHQPGDTTNDWRHQLRPARIGRGMCTSGK